MIFSPAAVAEEMSCAAGCTALGFLDVPEHRAYTTLPVPGDLVVLQYFHPGDSVEDDNALPLLHIASILHVRIDCTNRSSCILLLSTCTTACAP